MKKIVSTLLIAVLLVALFLSGSQTEKEKARKREAQEKLKIGVILVGDETESYSYSHIRGIQAAAKKQDIDKAQIKWKTRVDEPGECYDAAKELAADGCSLIISDSSSLEDEVQKAAEEFSDVQFVCIGGNLAKESGLSNFFNASTRLPEARYVSGVIAGMKLAELASTGALSEINYDENGNIRIGFVGSFPDDASRNDYAAFYFGVRSVIPNIHMDVEYTHCLYDMEVETTAADALMNLGCVIIAQHDGSTAVPGAIQARKDAGETVYYVGCNTDMLSVAPDAGLTSAVSNWKSYYTKLFYATKKQKGLTQDWTGGYKEKAVAVTEPGPECAEGTEGAAQTVIEQIKSGGLQVPAVSELPEGVVVEQNPVAEEEVTQ